MLYRWLFLLIFAALLPVSAQAQNQIRLHWDRYDTIVSINPDGSMDVQEQQVLVVDQGRLSRMTRNFNTGDKGRVTNIQVLEDGEQYSPGRDTPGTFSGVDAGDEAQIQLWFRDPDVNRHTFTIAYTVNDALIEQGDRAVLDWSFFWGSANAPAIRDGSVEIRFPTQVNASELRVDSAGAPVRLVSESTPLRWELTDPIQGDELRVQATFPRAVLAANADFRSAQTNTVPRGNQPATAPDPNAFPAPVPAGGGFDFMFCFVVLIFLIIAFSSIRSSARRRQSRGYPTSYGPSPSLGPDPFFGPAPRGRRRRRRYGGWGGGFFPPIIITPPRQSHDHDRSYGSPFDGDPSGGSGSSWGDSGGSGSSWGDSGGSGSSWGDSGGGGSSWGDSGGGGSSWGGGGGGGGGSDNNGGSGGGSFG